MKKALEILTVFLLILSLTACAGREIVPLPVADDYDIVAGATPSGKLRVGLVPGVYSDMFMEVIRPALEEIGYTIETIHYDDYFLPNRALSWNQIDLNMFQHYRSLNDYKFNNNAALSAIVEVPTAPMGIFSTVYKSIHEIKYGTKVLIPAESADLSRALIVLENAGLIALTPLKSKEKATESDVVYNPHGLIISPLRSEDLVQSLSACELAVIDGGYAANGNLKLSKALYREVMNEDYLVVVAVRTEDLHAQFVSDIISIVNSDEYREAVAIPGGAFADFQWPLSFFE